MSRPRRKQRTMTIPEIHEMCRLYQEDGLSMKQIAERQDRSMAMVHRYLHRWGVPVRPHGQMIGVPPATLPDAVLKRNAELYLAGLPMADVAAITGVSSSAVSRRLDTAGVRHRDRSEALLISTRRHRQIPPEKEARVVALYKAGANQTEVAEIVGVRTTTVRRVLSRNAIPVRPRSDAVSRGWERSKSGPLALAPDAHLRVSLRNRTVADLPVKTRAKAGRDWGGYVAAPPLAAAILREIALRAGPRPDPQDSTRTDVCQDVGVSVRRLFAWEAGEHPLTRFDVADRVLIGLDRFWWEVYDPQAHAPGLFSSRQRDDVLAWLGAVEVAQRLWEGDDDDVSHWRGVRLSVAA